MHTESRLRIGDQDEAEPIPLRRGTFQAVRKHHSKEAGLKTFKSLERRNQDCCTKRNSFLKPQIVAKRNIFGFKNSKKSLREFVANKNGFRKLDTNRSKTCNKKILRYSEKANKNKMSIILAGDFFSP